MTLQGLSKYLDKYDSQLSSAAAKQPELLEGLPFYDWSIRHSVANRITTFNNVIGLLQKNGQPFPLFDYEQMLFNELQRHKQVWIKKGNWLRHNRVYAEIYGMALLLLSKSNKIADVHCVTGPRIELAINLIDMMKALFHQGFMKFDTKETVIELNGLH